MHIENSYIFISQTLHRAFTNSSSIFGDFCDLYTSGLAFAFTPFESGQRKRETFGGRMQKNKGIFTVNCYVDTGPAYLEAQAQARIFQL